MQRINRIILSSASLFVLFVLIQTPSVLLGLKLASCDAIFSAAAVALPPLNIFGLTDKHIATTDRITLKGQAQGASEVIVNNESMVLDAGGNFMTGLVLLPGKNLVSVLAKWGGVDEGKRLRILRLTPFLDSEKPYDGKHWARKDIVNLATLGVIEGYPDGKFEPKKEVSRGELATWLVRAKDIVASKPKDDPFFDVPKEHWRAPYVRAAVLKGYMSGYSNDTFGVDDPLERAHAIDIIDRVEGLENGGDVKKIFEDVSLKSPMAKAIWRAYKARLIIGVSKESRQFEPARLMNRAEATTLLSRLPNIKDRVLALFDFDSGYTRSRMCKANVAPVVLWAKVSPYEAPRDGKTPVTIFVKADDRQGASDISNVRVDLRAIGGPPDAILFDDATHGDKSAGDGIFTVQFVISPDTEVGSKQLNIIAMDKSGWEGSRRIQMFVVKQW